MRDAVKDWFLTHPGWLLIYDNVSSYETVMKDYLPKISGDILLTSRFSKEAPGIKIRLGILKEKEAIELVKRRIYSNPRFPLPPVRAKSS